MPASPAPVGRMKTLLSAYQVDPTRGSEWATSWTWMLEHARIGHEVTCLTSVWGRGNREHLEAELAALDMPNLSIEFVELPGWFKGWGHTDSTLGLYFRYLLWQRVAARVAKRLDDERDFDLIHHVSWGNLQMGSGMWRVGKPLLFGPAGGGQQALPALRKYFEKGWRKEQVRQATSWLLRSCSPDYRRMLRKADHVLVVNPETEALAKQHAKSVEHTLQAPFSYEDVPDDPPTRGDSPELRLLWVGRLLPRKGLPLVLDALSQLKDVPYRLTVVGDGELEHRLPEWLKQYGVQDKVDWRGRLPFDEVKQAYRDHDVFLFPTLRDSNAGQLAEAMTYALPIVTLDIHGGATLVPDDAGIKVPATTPEETTAALASAVRRLAGDAELRRRMGEVGHRFVRDEILPWRRNFLQRYLAKFEPAASPSQLLGAVSTGD